jgi:glycosyltransferase involved in cell wall biosynthesis
VQIALVSRELYPYAGGGIAPIVAAAARELAEIADVTVVTSSSGRHVHDELEATGDPRLLPDSVRLVWVEDPVDEWGPFYSFMHLYSARVHAGLRAVYGDRGPDLIEFCDYLGEGLVTVQDKQTAASWLADTLIAVRLHTTSELCAVLDGHLPDDLETVALHDAERYVLRHADRILWSGGDVLATYQRFYGTGNLAPAVKLPDAFLRELEPVPGPGFVPKPGDPLMLLYLGRAERRKGVQNLVRAVASLERDDVRLALLGGDTDTGPLGVSLRTQLELMAAGDPRIQFMDPVPRHEVQHWVQQSHAVVIPSLWECWPNVGREALLLNRPILATPVGGLTELVQPGRSGFLARDTSAEAIADLIDRVAVDRDAVVRLIEREGPRAVHEELTDPGRLRDRYAELVRSRPARRPRPERRPLVSVVVPYFRLEEVVEETLASVRAQTYPHIELIVVNDGSLREADASLFELAERYDAELVTQPNSGLGAARNFGVAASRGEYVLPLDADDLLAPTFVERCVAALEANDALAYVTTYSTFFEPDGTRHEHELSGYTPYGNWTRMIERLNAAGSCSALLRRRVFERGFRYSTDLTSYEDWFLYRELAAAGAYGTIIPERLFLYRVRPQSMLREMGAPLVERYAGELRAYLREAEMRWTAADAATLGLPA